MAGKGGGAWKVAYADFVTAMMAFFMVMWLVGQKEDVKEAIAKYFEDPYGEIEPSDGTVENARHAPVPRGHGGAKHDDSPSKDPDDEVTKRLRVLTIHGSDRTVIGTVVVFPTDGVELDEEARRQIDRIVPKLVGMPQKIEVRGHASRQPKQAGQRDAWQLSYDRCLAVMQYLQERGVEPNRLRLTQAGVFEPFTIRGDGNSKSRNSRVEVFLLSELAEDLVGTPEERAARYQEETIARSGDGE
jgi:chemotaxis protein MotB